MTRVVPDGRLVENQNPGSADENQSLPRFRGSRLAYLDASHLEAYSNRDWAFDAVNGLALNLMRSGFLTLMLPRIDRERLERAAIIVSIAPARRFSRDERRRLHEFVHGGGVLICTTGAEEARASQSLLADFGLRVPLSPVPTAGNWREPEPMGNFRSLYLDARDYDAGDYKVGVPFHAGWPVEVTGENRANNRAKIGEIRRTSGRIGGVCLRTERPADCRLPPCRSGKSRTDWRYGLRDEQKPRVHRWGAFCRTLRKRPFLAVAHLEDDGPGRVDPSAGQARDGQSRDAGGQAMTRLWIGTALLSGSWLLGRDYFAPAHPIAWAVVLLVATVFADPHADPLAEPAAADGRPAPHAPRDMAAAGSPRRSRCLICGGLFLQLVPIPRRWPRDLGRGAVVAGTILFAKR